MEAGRAAERDYKHVAIRRTRKRKLEKDKILLVQYSEPVKF